MFLPLFVATLVLFLVLPFLSSPLRGSPLESMRINKSIKELVKVCTHMRLYLHIVVTVTSFCIQSSTDAARSMCVAALAMYIHRSLSLSLCLYVHSHIHIHIHVYMHRRQ